MRILWQLLLRDGRDGYSTGRNLAYFRTQLNPP
jgi:hypothetical protein